jgi:hypothetical protein
LSEQVQQHQEKDNKVEVAAVDVDVEDAVEKDKYVIKMQ